VAPGAADDAAARGPFQKGKQEANARFERSFLEGLLRDHQGNIKQASRASGIERTQLKRLLRKHKLTD
jgi:DNA-binding NtrC family response regulator